MAIRAVGLTKTFAGITVLNNVSLTVKPGTVHCIVGANGSGKSTLVRLLSGVYQPDDGTIDLNGRPMPGLGSPAEAFRRGVRVVHQEAPLIDTLTVAECVAVFHGYPVGAGFRVRWRELHDTVGRLFELMSISVDPRRLAATLAPAQRAMVALAIAMDDVERAASLLILDEADAAIPEGEAEPFLRMVRDVSRSGIPVLMVTHRLKEVTAIGDEVTILANGQVGYHGATEALTEEFLVAKMTASPHDETSEDPAPTSSPTVTVATLWEVAGRTQPPHAPTTPALNAAHLSASTLRDVSLHVDPGEIVGVAGLADSGAPELPLALAGALPFSAGTVTVAGRPLPPRFTPKAAIQAGIVLLPADRLRQGGITTLTVEDNLVLPQAVRFWHRSREQHAVVATALKTLDVRPRQPKTMFGALSGGNQQKSILAKWLLFRPHVLILDDPTSGVDAASRHMMFAALHEATEHGVGIILLSTELDQLASMCSRVIVLRRGAVATELRRDDGTLTREAITGWCYA